METAGRGPDTGAIAVNGWRESAAKIKAAGVVIRTEYEDLQKFDRTAREEGEWETAPQVPWEPHVRQALAELKRREEHDVEGLLPDALKAVC